MHQASTVSWGLLLFEPTTGEMGTACFRLVPKSRQRNLILSRPISLRPSQDVKLCITPPSATTRLIGKTSR
ncbi:hypothetical protein ABBQ38_005737 [Trebouxia sp. C0009 RCD-2024]